MRNRPEPFVAAPIALMRDVDTQMSFGERAALEGLLAQLKPRLSIEIGTAGGGTLATIAHYSEEVHAFDLEGPGELAARFPEVHFHTGDSHVLLPKALAEFAEQGRNVDFVLVDGDHSADGVRQDMDDLLGSPSIGTTIIAMHDTANETVREGLERVAYEDYPKVAFVELDFVAGYVMSQPHLDGELWGGLGLVWVDAGEPRGSRDIRETPYHPAGELLRVGRDFRFEQFRPGGGRLPEIVLVSREVHPLTRGGIGTHVHSAAAALASIANVTVITSSLSEPRYRELARARSPELPAGVKFEFVEEPAPDDIGSFYSPLHAYSARVYERLRELYPQRGPDLIEFPDYLGEGLVTVQAKRTLDPALRDTRVCVRTHTTLELAEVLNGHTRTDTATQSIFEAERYSLHSADTVIWQGGDILDTYHRFYGRDSIAADTERIPYAGAPVSQAPPTATRPADGPLRFLYVGRLERRKGVQELLQAVTSLVNKDWTLTLVGGDTESAPLGGSMRKQLELAAAGDARIEFIEGRSRSELAELYASHHVLLCPSRWECWPNVVLEALQTGLPVIGTPTGGLVEMLDDPRAGWLLSDRDPVTLAEMLDELVSERERVDELIESGGPRKVYEKLTGEEAIRDGYRRLAYAELEHPVRSNGSRPLVSVIVPYFRLHEFVGETIESIFAQDYPNLEVIVVNDGSLWPEDAVLSELADRHPIQVLTKANSGLGAARNSGIRQSRGKYVLPLDADNMVTPDFVSRCVDVLEHDPAVAYVTSWSLYVDESGDAHDGDDGYRPIGNSLELVMDENVAGDATAVIPRRIFEMGHWYNTDLTSYEDWQLYRELHEAGLFGRVIPEPLLLYRVRRGSMIREVGFPRRARLLGEMKAHLIERRMEWQQKRG